MSAPNPDLATGVAEVLPVAGSVEPMAIDPAATGAQAAPSPDAPMPAVNVSLRALVLSPDASIIIGKAGKHITEIRQESGARLTISPALPQSPERILTVSGPLDAVSRAFGLIVRRVNDEPFMQPSLPGSRAYTIRFIVPNSRMGSIIGKAGTKIKEIQEASGARLQAGETMLAGSTERMLSIMGVADAVHIAVYYVGLVLAENQDRGASSNLAYRPGAGAAAPYAGAYFPGAAPGAAPGVPYGMAPAPAAPPLPAGSQTQQIYIPDDLVGSVIGKGGSKINEIRQASGTHIKISDPSGAPERLVTVTGPAANIAIAVNMLHTRVEDERHRLQSAQ